MFASGDDGVGFNGHPTVSGPKCLGKENMIFNPTWPVNCPWVTAVGWTEVEAGMTVVEPESAAEQRLDGLHYSSGGGFSNVYSYPAYQEDAIRTYFAKHDPPYAHYSGLVGDSNNVYKKPDVSALAGSSGGVYNRIGRGIPDVGNALTKQYVDGTSHLISMMH
jgi:tripeptidyl-peptidase-1